MPALWKNIEARRQERYDRRKAATQKAAEAKAAEEETLRKKMEAGNTRPPVRLTKREMMLIAANHKAPKNRLMTAAVSVVKR
jgi:hypothetical protein